LAKRLRQNQPVFLLANGLLRPNTADSLARRTELPISARQLAPAEANARRELHFFGGGGLVFQNPEQPANALYLYQWPEDLSYGLVTWAMDGQRILLALSQTTPSSHFDLEALVSPCNGLSLARKRTLAGRVMMLDTLSCYAREPNRLPQPAIAASYCFKLQRIHAARKHPIVVASHDLDFLFDG